MTENLALLDYLRFSTQIKAKGRNFSKILTTKKIVKNSKQKLKLNKKFFLLKIKIIKKIWGEVNNG